MKQRVRLLSLTVGATVVLLLAAGALMVVGIFNGTLGWDIFSPRMESYLYGVFGSCIALAAVGVAMTVVMGTQEIVKAFRGVLREKDGADAPAKEASRGAYAKCMLYVVVVFALLISALSVLNHQIQRHRSSVYKKLIAEQMVQFNTRAVDMVSLLTEPPRSNVPRDVFDLIKTFNGLSFISKTTLYMPDPENDSAMWGYTAWRNYNKEDGFARFFVAKDFEKAMASAVDGERSALEDLNALPDFTWYHVVTNGQGEAVAVLRFDGNTRENFREYSSLF